MKKGLLSLLCFAFFVFSCEKDSIIEEHEQTAVGTETSLEEEMLVPVGEEDTTLILDEESENFDANSNRTFSIGMSSKSTKYGYHGHYWQPKILQECKVIDADRSPFGDRQQNANFWWSKTAEGNDYFDRSTYFSSTEEHCLKFIEYDNGTANIKGSTVYGTCVVTVDVWLKEKKNWQQWSSEGGDHKKEGTAGNASDETQMHFYVIDSERSIIIAEGGDCVQEGVFGVEQRPDPNDPNSTNFGAHIGPGGANLDSEIGALGFSTWGWLIDPVTKERLWLIDFNFKLDCVEECKPCEGKVEKLTLKFDWHRKKRVKVYQKLNRAHRGVKIFDKVLMPGEEFMIQGANRDGSFGNYVYIYINHCYYTKIKTNCYLKIGPGYTKGVLKVVNGRSTRGGELCEYEKPKYKRYRYW